MKTIKLIFTAVFFICISVCYAAPSPPPSTTGGTTGPACWPPPCVPIDNGIIFLIVAGVLYGAKKIYDFRKSAQTLS